MRRTLLVVSVVSVLTAGLALVGHHVWHVADTRWAWRQADLDRNRLDLASYRGAETGADLGEWVERGEVVETGGRTVRIERGGDAFLVVRYERSVGLWREDRVEAVCYRFSLDGESSVAFEETRCPDR